MLSWKSPVTSKTPALNPFAYLLLAFCTVALASWTSLSLAYISLPLLLPICMLSSPSYSSTGLYFFLFLPYFLFFQFISFFFFGCSQLSHSLLPSRRLCCSLWTHYSILSFGVKTVGISELLLEQKELIRWFWVNLNTGVFGQCNPSSDNGERIYQMLLPSISNFQAWCRQFFLFFFNILIPSIKCWSTSLFHFFLQLFK